MHHGLFELVEDTGRGKMVRATLEGESLKWSTEYPVDDDRHRAYFESVLLLVQEAVNRGVGEIELSGIETLIVKQIRGEWKINKASAHRLCVEIRSLLPHIPKWRFCVTEDPVTTT